jgi:hypothetical protein
MHKRAILAAVVGGALAAAAAFVACSSNSSSSQPADAGIDVFYVTPEATLFDVPSADSFIAAGDAGDGGTGSMKDSSVACTSDARGLDVAIAACSVVTGQCDIVTQNCSCGNECNVVQIPDGSFGTVCQPDQTTEHLPKGAACCPSANGVTNPCDPGLECNGGLNCAADAASPGAGLPPGWGGSRCTPRCCISSDGGSGNAVCGTAGDGGTAGQCSLGISYVNNGPSEYYICTYPQTCEPLGIHPCPSGYGCEVQNAAGTSNCSIVYNPNGPSGATSGQACMYENQCADGLVCIGASADASTCAWMCHITGQATPFDAGALSAEAGQGGCPSGQTCGGVNGFPNWLGACGT